ncbi:hypothetical protein ACFBZI_07730 [Moraxella sp. ZJ142]|uniref:hypothetical protein n=1 Tax=Moraxella marmotae TaxID=3344520 RepID=UPI0035D4C5A6
MTKTPEYTLRAIKKYQQKRRQKRIDFHIEKDAELLAKIDADDGSFSELCRKLLRQHYQITETNHE